MTCKAMTKGLIENFKNVEQVDLNSGKKYTIILSNTLITIQFNQKDVHTSSCVKCKQFQPLDKEDASYFR